MNQAVVHEEGGGLSSPVANGVRQPHSPAYHPPPPLPPLPPSPPPRLPYLTPFLRSCISRIPPLPSIPPTPYSIPLSQPPFITLTYAQSLDGSLASSPTPPTPLLLSSPPSMTITHLLRSLHSCLLIGRGTLQSDNPRLTTRLCPGPSPTPVILDSSLRMDEGSRVLHSHPTVWLVCTDDNLPPDLHPPVVLSSPEVERIDGAAHSPIAGGKWQRLRRLVGLGCVIVVLPTSPGSSHVPLALALTVLGRYFPSIMVEGGAGLITSCLTLLRGEGKGVTSPIHQVIVTLAPVYVGGVRSVTRLMEEPFPRLHSMTCEKVGEDVILRGLVNEQREEEEEGEGAVRLQAVWSTTTEKLARLLKRLSESMSMALRCVTVKRVAAAVGVAIISAVVCCDAVLSLDAQLLSKRWSSGVSQWGLWLLRYLHSRRSYVLVPLLLLLYFKTTPPSTPTPTPVQSSFPTTPVHCLTLFFLSASSSSLSLVLPCPAVSFSAVRVLIVLSPSFSRRGAVRPVDVPTPRVQGECGAGGDQIPQAVPGEWEERGRECSQWRWGRVSAVVQLSSFAGCVLCCSDGLVSCAVQFTTTICQVQHIMSGLRYQALNSSLNTPCGS